MFVRQYLSNGRFRNADHQAVVNSNSSRLSIATFQNPAQDATVYPLKIREGEKSVLDEPITFAEMYRRKMSKVIEIAKKKKLAEEQQLTDLETAKLETKPIEEILAWKCHCCQVFMCWPSFTLSDHVFLGVCLVWWWKCVESVGYLRVNLASYS